MILDDKQNLAITWAKEGKSFILAGTAGTGKSTTLKKLVNTLLENNNYPLVDYRVKGIGDYIQEKGLAIVTYTNSAKNVIKKILHQEENIKTQLNYAITTIHNLLESSLVDKDDLLPGENKFYFKKNEFNKLEVKTLIIDEGSLIDFKDMQKLLSALDNCQLIIVGDYNQIRPAFGHSAYYKLLCKLPIIILENTYRQEYTNPLIKQANRVLLGLPPKHDVIENKGLAIPEFQFSIPNDEYSASFIYGNIIKQMINMEHYDPLQDIILCPFRVGKRYISCDFLNGIIANLYSVKEDNLIYEINIGEKWLYLAVGDYVKVDKELGVIIDIEENTQWDGLTPDDPEVNRLRVRRITNKRENVFKKGISLDDLDNEEYERENRFKKSSHIVTVELLTSDDLVTLKYCNQFSDDNFTLGYVTTFHKAQGEQYRNAFLIIHSCHNHMMNREMLYTGMTRSTDLSFILIENKKDLYKISKRTSIRGQTQQERIQWLKNFYRKDLELDISNLSSGQELVY